MKIIIVFGWKDNGKHWLKRELTLHGFDVSVIDYHKNISENRKLNIKFLRQFITLCDCFKLAYKAYKSSNENDVIIAWSFFTGELISTISVINGNKRKILALNNLGRKRKLISKIFLCIHYYLSLKNENFITTGNTEEIKKLIHERLKIKKSKIFLLPDAYDEEYSFSKVEIVCKKYIFSGGYENRDWNTYLEVAGRKKDYTFNLVCGRDSKILDPPQNVCIFKV